MCIFRTCEHSCTFRTCIDDHSMYREVLWSPQDDDETLATFGITIGWISCACYIMSRLPQIRMNYKLKSTRGVSKITFFALFLANFFYNAGIFLHSTDWEYIRWQLPWIIGPFGAIIEDGTVLVQAYIYRHNHFDPNIAPCVACNREEDLAWCQFLAVDM